MRLRTKFAYIEHESTERTLWGVWIFSPLRNLFPGAWCSFLAGLRRFCLRQTTKRPHIKVLAWPRVSQAPSSEATKSEQNSCSGRQSALAARSSVRTFFGIDQLILLCSPQVAVCLFLLGSAAEAYPAQLRINLSTRQLAS